MPPTISILPTSSPTTTPETLVHIISSLLTPSECTALITEHDASLISHDVTLTVRKRTIFSDADLACLLWERLAPFFGDETIVDEEGYSWSASHLNPRFRYCKYETGGMFESHVDGRRLASVDEQSFMTVNIYLNTVPAEYGGCTRVLEPCSPCIHVRSSGRDDKPPHTHTVLASVAPRTGCAAVFRDCLFHDGEALRGGVKYLLRTDVMFKRDQPFDLDSACEGMDPEHKGRRAWALAVKLEDGNNFDEAIAWYMMKVGG
jgi:hypothetical protein